MSIFKKNPNLTVELEQGDEKVKLEFKKLTIGDSKEFAKKSKEELASVEFTTSLFARLCVTEIDGARLTAQDFEELGVEQIAKLTELFVPAKN